jgi:xanthine dehydrogenase iron-sulfur cluster and FAD-binding subunit A
VITPEVGGGFGSKLNVYAEEALLGWIAMQLGKPVKWIEGRRENIQSTIHGRGQVGYVEIGCKQDGTITGLRYDVFADLGAYHQLLTPAIPTLTGLMLSGSYRIPAIQINVTGCFTNKMSTDAYRGAGRPEAIIALEAEMVAVGKSGERTIKAGDFFVDLLTTALDPGEILREIRVPKPAGRFGHAYQKVRHPASGLAVVGVAVALLIGAGGECERAGIGVTGVASKAYRATAVEQALQGQTLNEQTIAEAAARATDGVDANSDLYASEDYRRHLAKVYTKRAIQEAVTAAG